MSAHSIGYSQAFLDAEYERHCGPDLPDWTACMGCGEVNTDPSPEEVDAANSDAPEGEGRPEVFCTSCAAWDAGQPRAHPQGPHAPGVGMHGRRWVTGDDVRTYHESREG